jgi:hypothetical protein
MHPAPHRESLLLKVPKIVYIRTPLSPLAVAFSETNRKFLSYFESGGREYCHFHPTVGDLMVYLYPDATDQDIRDIVALIEHPSTERWVPVGPEAEEAQKWIARLT